MGRSRSRRRRTPPSSSDGEEEAEEEEPSLRERVVMLEVENETLKAENVALRKRLLEVLRGSGGGGGGGPQRRAGRHEAKEDAPQRRKAKANEDPPDDRAHRRPAKPAEADVQEERPHRRRADEDPADERAHRRPAKPAEAGVQEERPHRRRAKAASESEEEGNQRKAAEAKDSVSDKIGQGCANDRDNESNAVMLANSFGEVYNEPITNNQPVEKRNPLVQAKLEKYLAHFDEKCAIVDLKSGGSIIKDRRTFSMRYNCVFRESGAKLKCITQKRFYYDWVSAPTFVLDFETHTSLVTATPGTRQDGSLGVRDPRTEHLIVLYEERKGKVSCMWLAQDVDKLGQQPTAGEAILLKHPLVKQFEKKIEERREGKIAARIFHNYHDVKTIG